LGFAHSFHPDDWGDAFIPVVGFYKSHTASHPRKRHPSRNSWSKVTLEQDNIILWVSAIIAVRDKSLRLYE
jgi:hypothetical protein